MNSVKALFRLAAILVAAVILSACTDDDSVVSTDPGAAASEDVTEAAARSIADDSAPSEVVAAFDPGNRSSLPGTIWNVTSVNGEPYSEGELTIGENGAVGETYQIAFADSCSAGTTWFRVHSEDNFEVYPNRNAACPGHPTSVLRGEANSPITVLVSGEELFIETPNGTVTAVLESATGQRSTPPLSALPTVDVAPPEFANLADIPEATDIAVPICASSGEAGLEFDPLADERLATSERFSLVIHDLPFVVWSSGAGGNLYHHEFGIGLSVRYQPTIDWIAENIPEGHVCIDIPPPGFYDVGPSFPEWELVTDPAPGDTTLTVQHQGDCAPHLPLDPVVVETAAEIRVAMPLAQPQYGMSFTSDCQFVTPVAITLDAPVGSRSIEPLTELPN